MTDLHVQTKLDGRRGWAMVRLVLRGVYGLPLVLDTGTLYSAISEETRDDLDAQGLVAPLGRNRWLLRELTLEGHPIADLPVRLSRRASAVGAPGMLGLDFLARYSEVCFHFASMRLMLRQE